MIRFPFIARYQTVNSLEKLSPLLSFLSTVTRSGRRVREMKSIMQEVFLETQYLGRVEEFGKVVGIIHPSFAVSSSHQFGGDISPHHVEYLLRSSKPQRQLLVPVFQPVLGGLLPNTWQLTKEQ